MAKISCCYRNSIKRLNVRAEGIVILIMSEPPQNVLCAEHYLCIYLVSIFYLYFE